VYAATAEPAQVLQFDGDDILAQVYENDEPFLLGAAADGKGGICLATASLGEVLRVSVTGGETGLYTSEVLDCGMTAKWGQVRWHQLVTGRSVIGVETRSGNTADPDAAWSPWSPMMSRPDGTPIASPNGRYLQFRVRFLGKAGDTVRLDRIDLQYRTLNRAPVLAFASPDAGANVRDKVTVSWKASDPDEDEPEYEAFYAKAGTNEWTKIDAEATASDDESSEEGDDASGGDAEGDEKPSATPKRSNDKPAAGNAVGAASARHRPASTRPQPRQIERGPGGLGSSSSGRPKFMDKAKRHDSGSEAPSVDEDLSDEELEWDTSALPDGQYVLKVVASDAKRNPDDPKTVEVFSRVFTVDNTAPTAPWQAPEEAAALPATFVFREALSWIGSAEYRFDDGDWLGWVPADGLCDQPEETFAAPKLPVEPGEYVLQMRVRDAAGNVLRTQWPVKVAAP